MPFGGTTVCCLQMGLQFIVGTLIFVIVPIPEILFDVVTYLSNISSNINFFGIRNLGEEFFNNFSY